MSKYQVCPRCEGEGTHTNPSIDGNGITSSEMAELGPEFEEAYFSGRYDVQCELCRGRRVVTVEDREEYQQRADDHYTAAMESGDSESANYWRRRR